MASHQSYGSRRLVTAMSSAGFDIGRYKVRSLMRQPALKPVWKRKFVHATDSKHDCPIAANVLNRQFNPGGPNLAYVSDISYIRTGAGWLYLATVLDLYARKVVGWAMAPSMPAKLVCDALNMAIQQRRPAPGLIVHSDRGSQYASELYQDLLTRHGFVCSMMERVWQRQYANHTKAKAAITTTSSASITASASIQFWAICRPLSTNRKWQNVNLSLCPKLLDHRSRGSRRGSGAARHRTRRAR